MHLAANLEKITINNFNPVFNIGLKLLFFSFTRPGID